MNVYILFSVDTGVSFTIMTQRDEGGKNVSKGRKQYLNLLNSELSVLNFCMLSKKNHNEMKRSNVCVMSNVLHFRDRINYNVYHITSIQ